MFNKVYTSLTDKSLSLTQGRKLFFKDPNLAEPIGICGVAIKRSKRYFRIKKPTGFGMCQRGKRMGLNHFCKPRLLLVIALLFCWDSRKGTEVHASHHKNVRLRAPSSYTALEERMAADQGSISPAIGLDETAIVGPFIGNIAEEVLQAPRNKKDCGMPSIAARGLVGPTIKRSYFAYTPEELQDKVAEEHNRQKREVKRNEITEAPLPWTCETKYEWKDMGADHYPRFVRTAECKTRSCFNGFFRCRPRRYKTKVLKRVSPSDSTSCEEDDVSLPESLRSSWRFITVTINLCCDCTGRVPGAAEV